MQDFVSPSPARLRPWRDALLALLVAGLILVVASAAGYAAGMLFDAWTAFDTPRAFAAGEPEALTTSRLAFYLIVFQAVTVALVFVASRRFGTAEAPLLRFEMPRAGATTLAVAALVQISVAMLYAKFVYSMDPQAFGHDLGLFAELMKSRTWWLLLIAAGIGAPLAEECLFRGFLYGTLKRTPFATSGATVITSVLWALLHASYSPYGLIAIGLTGFYFAYLREKTGTVLTSMVCHGAYNSLIVLALAFAPEGALPPG